VLFLPNCLARLNGAPARLNKEADFLVCKDGKWGILEVDGEPFHPPSMAAEDHERQRLFRRHGIRVFERFTSRRCYNEAHHVVAEFLEILDKSG
jgi:very-short-patch-repair endonuclease